MRYVTNFTCICAILLALWGLPALASGPFSLDLVLEAPSNLQVFFLEDLNVSGQAPSAQVFHATIKSSELTDTECYLVFIMSNPQTEIIRGDSKPNGFVLRANSTFTVSNLDLTAENGAYELKNYEVSDEADVIKDKLIQTGYFPSDTYNLSLELHRSSDDSLLATDQVTAVITNPFTLQLISPAGTPASPTLIGSTTPVFSWASPATQFLLKICERTSPDQDVESVMQSRPLCEQSLSGQSFAYPTSGVLPLEPGHTYFWQVTSLVQTSSGQQEYPSAVGAFSTLQTIDPQTQRIVTALQRILGFGNMTVMDQLVGFQPSGTIRLDGLGIAIDDLEEMALKFEQGAFRTTSVRAE